MKMKFSKSSRKEKLLKHLNKRISACAKWIILRHKEFDKRITQGKYSVFINKKV